MRYATMPGLTSAKRWQLRRIFLQKRANYSPTEAARVLGLSRPNVVAMIEEKAIDADARLTYRLPWLAIAENALDRYTVAELIEALGKEAKNIVPPLLFPAEPLNVTLPLYLRRLLEHLASDARMTVDACLAFIVREYAEEIVRPTPAQIEEAIPGFHDAIMFPDEPETLP